MKAGPALAPHRAALLDQVLAILRDAAPMPVGTHAIGAALGPYRPRWRERAACPDPGCAHNHHYWREAHYVRAYHPAQVFTPMLRSAVKRGLVERIPRTPGRRLDAYGQDYWRWIGGESPELAPPAPEKGSTTWV